MKKIIAWIVLLLIIPIFIVIFPKDDNIDYFKSRQNKVVRVKRLSTNEIDLINLEDYIIGVLAGEMPIYFNEEALKAQAVAARSYCISRLNDNNEYDVVDSVLNQVYLDDDYLKEAWGVNYNTNIKKLKKVVKETSGEYLTYNKKVVDALFFSTSNGYTENVENVFNLELPYLVSVESNWDSQTNPIFETTIKYDRNKFCSKLDIKDCSYLTISNINKSTTNIIESITINNKKYTGRDIYTKLGIRSTDFEFKVYKDNIAITTKGHGHGVGMSQYGAQGMALNGYNYTDILKHYYTDTIIKKIV